MFHIKGINTKHETSSKIYFFRKLQEEIRVLLKSDKRSNSFEIVIWSLKPRFRFFLSC